MVEKSKTATSHMDRSDQVFARGRSSRSNASGRFEQCKTENFDDGWSGLDDDESERVDTTLTAENAKTILSRSESPDIGFDRSVNPYRGCEHGCIYCFARPTHAYLGLSPGLDFETKLFFKPEAANLLRKELSTPGYAPERVQLGANTDCYQPIEKRLRITRAVVEVLAEFQHPLGITTKNHLVTRDIDLLAPMAERGLSVVVISITTLDRQLARDMEPRASTPARRLDAIRALSRAGIPVIVSVAPIIPGLTDHEIESIMEGAAEAGAQYAHYSILRLSHELKDLFIGIASVDDPNLEAPLLENFVNRDPVDPGRFHHDRLDPALCEPISKPVQIASERSERPDRFGIARGADGRHVNCHGAFSTDDCGGAASCSAPSC
jgi:DNA repair photolyase